MLFVNLFYLEYYLKQLEKYEMDKICNSLGLKIQFDILDVVLVLRVKEIQNF